MKFVISTQELNYLLNKCQPIVAGKPTTAILGNILIEAVNNELILTACDNTIGIRCFTEAKILEEGVTTLPARTFGPLIRELTAINVEISTNENHITQVKADSSRFKLNGMDRNGFPHLPDLAGVPFLTLPQKEFKEVINRTFFAISRDDKRHELMGLSFTLNEGRATFTGTDGKKLARSFVSYPVASELQGNYILPAKAVDEVQKCLEDEGEVKIYFLSDKIAFQTANTLVVAKLVSGEYPDVDQVIPQQISTHVVLHRQELMTLLRQVSLFRTDTSHSACFSFGDGQLTLFANTMELGEGKVSMPVDWRAPSMEIAFNPTVFLDILKHCKNETVTLGLIDQFNPGILSDTSETSVPEPCSNPLFLVMPMRLANENSDA